MVAAMYRAMKLPFQHDVTRPRHVRLRNSSAPGTRNPSVDLPKRFSHSIDKPQPNPRSDLTLLRKAPQKANPAKEEKENNRPMAIQKAVRSCSSRELLRSPVLMTCRQGEEAPATIEKIGRLCEMHRLNDLAARWR